jgi:two-component sensor histidine kinase
MQVLYDKLYRKPETMGMALADYLPALVQQVTANFPNCAQVRIDCQVCDTILDPLRLQTLGIIVNELLTNIMKYSFEGRTGGAIRVKAAESDGRVTLCVHDDGVGMPMDIDFTHSPGFGLELVRVMSDQLQGDIRIDRQAGTTICLEFPVQG